MMKIQLSRILCIALVFSIDLVEGQIPDSFLARGVGGGGALFAPSINPVDENEVFISSDMSEVFHSTDFGQHYEVVDFRALQGGHYSKIAFTNNAAIRYCIDYSDNRAVPVKTTDGGLSWSELPGNPDGTEETFSLYADFNNPNRLLISYYSTIYFSNDGGAVFTAIHTALDGNAGVHVGGVFFDGQQIFIGTNDGLLVSSNGGSSFAADASSGIQAGQVIFSFAGARQGNATRFFILTADVLDVYVGTMGWDYWGFIRGVYSLDYGSGAWVNRLPGIVTAQDYLMFIAMAENDTGTAYLAGASYLGQPNVMRWRSSTNQWQHVFQTSGNQNIYTGWCGEGGDHGWTFPECVFGIAVARNNSQKVIITDYSCVHKTSDGGVTWQQAYLSSQDQHVAGSNTPTNQAYHSSGIENTSCWQLFWRDQTHVFAACSDITAMRSDDAGVSWSFSYTGINANTVYRIVRNISNTTLYAATSSVHDLYQSTRLQDAILDAANATGKVLFSADNGNTWQTLHDFAHPVYWIATDPNNANRMYASVVNHGSNLGGIWVSDNIQLGGSSTWTRITPPGRTEGHPGTIQVLSDGTVLCTFNGRRNVSGAFTQSSGVFTYVPGLQQWSDKSDSRMFYWTQDVVIDPNDPTQNTWYAGVYNGWGGPPNGLGGLYKTTNRGNSWTRILTTEGVTSVTFNPSNTSQLFIATETDGLLTSLTINDAAPGFQPVLSYPFRQPHRIFFNPYNTNELWVTSFGNGIRLGDMTSTDVQFGNQADGSGSLFPNPATISVRLDQGATGDKVRSITIIDSQGTTVVYRKLKVPHPLMEEVFDVSGLQPGIYFVGIDQESTTAWQKLVIAR